MEIRKGPISLFDLTNLIKKQLNVGVWSDCLYMDTLYVNFPLPFQVAFCRKDLELLSDEEIISFIRHSLKEKIDELLEKVPQLTL